MRKGVERHNRRRKQTSKTNKGWLPEEDTNSPLNLEYSQGQKDFGQ